jgi:hypothetical protein
MNAPVSWYSIDKTLAIVEHGVVRKDEAFLIIDNYYANLKPHYESGEEAIAETSFGFQKADSEFIEICYNSANIMFKYEISVPRKIFFVNIPKVIRKERILHSHEELRAMVSAFYELDRHAYLAHVRTK